MSGPQTEVNPYVFSCAGGSVCYRNMFDGGFSQWGCGTASDQAATVVNSASGLTTDLARPTHPERTNHAGNQHQRVQQLCQHILVVISDVDFILIFLLFFLFFLIIIIIIIIFFFNFVYRLDSYRRPCIGHHHLCRHGRNRYNLPHGRHPSGGTGFAALAHDDSDAFETAPGAASCTNPAPTNDHVQHRVPARKTAASSPSPPAPMPFQSDVSPVEHHASTPPSHTTPPPPAQPQQPAFRQAPSPPTLLFQRGNSDGTGANQGGGQYPAAYAGAGSSGSAALSMMGMNLNRGAERHLESDQVPLTSAAAAAGSSSREIDDFSQGFHAALGRIGEEDEEEEDDHDMHGGGGLGQVMQAGYRDDETAAAAAGLGGEEGGTNESASGQGRPLWQQNRRQSRNLMWM
ncbi:hypothetical protein NEMBOFW57_006885 [Staphylotrichum longicolle]|uniref:Uncharacterized protein n=1 Tax=Staphylotrichum longicolle TaxID=669026 RepID=A0AAD4HUT6_9PEZI|nr:hypothetical protein NEMBOFW57_006885 [Staphylotrichum longicolle]